MKIGLFDQNYVGVFLEIISDNLSLIHETDKFSYIVVKNLQYI
jgi:hypothetical protein